MYINQNLLHWRGGDPPQKMPNNQNKGDIFAHSQWATSYRTCTDRKSVEAFQTAVVDRRGKLNALGLSRVAYKSGTFPQPLSNVIKRIPVLPGHVEPVCSTCSGALHSFSPQEQRKHKLRYCQSVFPATNRSLNLRCVELAMCTFEQFLFSSPKITGFTALKWLWFVPRANFHENYFVKCTYLPVMHFRPTKQLAWKFALRKSKPIWAELSFRQFLGWKQV